MEKRKTEDEVWYQFFDLVEKEPDKIHISELTDEGKFFTWDPSVGYIQKSD